MKKINIQDWKEFKISSIFDIRRPAKRSVKQYEEGNIPFVSSGNYNNGIDSYRAPLENELLEEGNCITVSPVDGSTFYQETDFLGRGGGGSSILLLYNKNLNKNIGLFLSTVIRSTLTRKYQYNDMGSSESIKEEYIKLPVDINGEPDWEYMERYVKQLYARERESSDHVTTYVEKSKSHKIDLIDWKEFKILDFFTEKKVSKKIVKTELLEAGKVPVFSSESSYKNAMGYVDSEAEFKVSREIPFYIIFGDHTKSIRIINKNFCVTDNVKVLIPKIFSYAALTFLTTVWVKNIPDLGYSRHWKTAKNTGIMLPVKKNDKPDWQYMEEYMKKLETSMKNMIKANNNSINVS